MGTAVAKPIVKENCSIGVITGIAYYQKPLLIGTLNTNFNALITFCYNDLYSDKDIDKELGN